VNYVFTYVSLIRQRPSFEKIQPVSDAILNLPNNSSIVAHDFEELKVSTFGKSTEKSKML
jgi:hypothetical protein